MGWYGGFAPYVRVADRKRIAAKTVEKLKKKGQLCQPIVIEGRTIANTFWGKAWCNHLESYSDYANRLPRGRTYVRNGSVIDLKVAAGEITALVSGSSIYKVKIAIDKVIKNTWSQIVDNCAGKIDSLIELLQGKFSKGVMEIITDPQKGLFPEPKEITLSCSCPDWADMCKHVAAVLYGVGARLDNKPEELFMLRQADHVELIATAGTTSLTQTTLDQSDHILADSDLSSLFGIDMGDTSAKDLKSPQKNDQLKNKKIVKKPIKTMKAVKAKSASLPKATVVKKTTTKKKAVVAKKISKKTSKVVKTKEAPPLSKVTKKSTKKKTVVTTKKVASQSKPTAKKTDNKSKMVVKKIKSSANAAVKKSSSKAPVVVKKTSAKKASKIMPNKKVSKTK